MTTTLDQYREAKTNYLKLRNQAKKELIARFNELAGQLVQIQRELLDDFGEKVSMPAKVAAKKKAKAPRETTANEVNAPAAPVEPSPQMAALQKQIERQKKKLSDAKAAGKPTKPFEDRVHELEDELRLLSAK